MGYTLYAFNGNVKNPIINPLYNSDSICFIEGWMLIVNEAKEKLGWEDEGYEDFREWLCYKKNELVKDEINTLYLTILINRL